MLLNNETFARVKSLSGYDKVQYNGAFQEGGVMLVKFLCYDGPEIEPTRSAFLLVNEAFEVVRVEDHVYSLAVDDEPIRRVTSLR